MFKSNMNVLIKQIDKGVSLCFLCILPKIIMVSSAKLLPFIEN